MLLIRHNSCNPLIEQSLLFNCTVIHNNRWSSLIICSLRPWDSPASERFILLLRSTEKIKEATQYLCFPNWNFWVNWNCKIFSPCLLFIKFGQHFDCLWLVDTMVVVKRWENWFTPFLRGSKVAVPEGPRRMQNFTVAGAEGQSLRMNQNRRVGNIPWVRQDRVDKKKS